MLKNIQFCVLLWGLILSALSSAETFMVEGEGLTYYHIYDELNRDSINSYTKTGKSIDLAPGNYYLRVQNVAQAFTLNAGQSLTFKTGKILVVGTGLSSYRVFDELEQEDIRAVYTNTVTELLPGTYVVQLNNSKQTALVVAGEQTTLTAGRINVQGIGLNTFYVYDEFGRNAVSVGYSSTTNGYIEMFAGRFLVKINDSEQFADVVAGQETTLSVGVLTVAGIGKDRFYVYDSTGEQSQGKAYLGYYTNEKLELFPGQYVVKLNNVTQQVSVEAGQTTQVATGYLQFNHATSTVFHLYDEQQTTKFTGYHGHNMGEKVELFPGTYYIEFDSGGGQPVTVTANEADVEPVTPDTPTTPIDNTNSTYQEGFTAGIKQCRENPTTCGISSIQAGIAKCQQNPASCDIIVNPVAPDTNGSTEEGIEQCRQDPDSCDIPDTNGSTQEGINKCREEPASCDIDVNDNNNDGSTEAGMQLCRDDPAACGITATNEDEQARYNPLTGELYIPDIRTPLGAEGSILIYRAYLNQQPDSFDFRLDFGRLELQQ